MLIRHIADDIATLLPLRYFDTPAITIFRAPAMIFSHIDDYAIAARLWHYLLLTLRQPLRLLRYSADD